MTGEDPAVDALEAAVYRLPTDLPEADGTLAWDATTAVVVQVRGGGQNGLGWTYTDASAAHVVTGLLADVARGRPALDPPGATHAMLRAARNAGVLGLVAMAVSAVDIALWDLKARLLDLPLSRVLGAVREDAPVHASGGFTSYDEAATRAQVEGWLDRGFDRVKIKIGESWGTAEGRDLTRTRLVRDLVRDEVDLLVDANGGYTRKQAVRVARCLDDLGVVGFEEPVSSDDRDGLRLVRDGALCDVAAGEYASRLSDVAAPRRCRRRRLPPGRCQPVLRRHGVAARRCGGGWCGARGLGALRPAGPRPPGDGHPQPASSRVVPRPRALRATAVRWRAGAARGPGPT